MVLLCAPLGGVGNKSTFRQLLNKGYVPFTNKELIGEDSVEVGKVWIGTEVNPVENGKDISLQEMFNKTLFGNYTLCTVDF